MGIEGRPPREPFGARRFPKEKNRLPPVSRQMEDNSKELRDAIPRSDNGDPSLSRELTMAMCELIREGNTLDNSCRVVGLQRTVLEGWLVEGRTDVAENTDTPCAKMIRALDIALGDQERTYSRAVFAAAVEDPRLALQILSIRNPEKWAPAAAEPPNWEARYQNMDIAQLKAEVGRLMKENNGKD